MKIFCSLLVMLYLTAATCLGQVSNADLQKQLQTTIVGKMVTIRNFYAGGYLDYRADGTLKSSSPKQGPWTINAEMRPEKINVNNRRIKISGTRLYVSFPNGSPEPKSLRAGKVEIEIDRDASADPMAALGKVFLGRGEKLSDEAPVYWKHFLKYREANPSGGDPKDLGKNMLEDAPGWELSTKQPQSAEAMKEARAAGTNFFPTATDVDDEERNKIHRVGGGVSAPRAISTPDPNFSEEALIANYEAKSVLWVVIDTDGHPRNIQVERPAGFGLDEKAVAAVQNWKFVPAMLNGVPTVVQVNVEVNFNLYHK